MSLIRRAQIDLLQQVLESVTGQDYICRVEQNADGVLLISWKNETHVDYLMHVLYLSSDAFQFCLAVQRFRDITQRYDRRLSRLELTRLLDDPFQCVRYWVGQIQG